MIEFQGSRPSDGNASGATIVPSRTASNPAAPDPQCVVAATAAKSGAKGAPEKNGHEYRVSAAAAAVVTMAMPYGRRPEPVDEADVGASARQRFCKTWAGQV